MRVPGMRVLWLLTFLPSPLWAQIDVPERVDVGSKLVAVCTAPVPDGGRLSILWNTSPGLEVEQVDSRLFLWGPAGEYAIDAVVIPLKTITVDDQTFDVIAGQIQRHAAKVTIGEPPPDPPSAAPFPAPGLAVLILREASQTTHLPASQQTIFTSPTVLNWLKENCVKLPDGNPPNQPAFRSYDDDYDLDELANAPEVFRVAYPIVIRAARDRERPDNEPWIAISDGKRGYSGPLPATVGETMELLRKYGE